MLDKQKTMKGTAMPITTAINELHARVETLDGQITRALERASELHDAATVERDMAAKLALLCTQYKRILETVLGSN